MNYDDEEYEDGKVLEQKLKIKTIGDLAKFKYAKVIERR